jgi:hypothetical protein
MFRNFSRLLRYGHSMQRINMALARGALTSSVRRIDPTLPNSWEFTAFSQNGEDGIIDYLVQELRSPSRYFVEIGAADGIENNTTWLAIGRKYSGLMIEGNPRKSRRARKLLSAVNARVKTASMFVTKESGEHIKQLAGTLHPDCFSLDIDGNDYYIAESLMEAGFRPRIFVVEYNSAFGPEASLTIKYRSDFRVSEAYGAGIYYGVSIGGWRRFFERYGFEFVTVDMSGINAFFVDAKAFPSGFSKKLKGMPFAENQEQLLKFRAPWSEQFKRIKGLELIQIR